MGYGVQINSLLIHGWQVAAQQAESVVVMVDRFVLGMSLVALDLLRLFAGGLQVRLSRAF